MTNSGISKVKDDDKSLYRVESIYEGSSNYSLVNDVPTVSSYYSITSGNISETMESLKIQIFLRQCGQKICQEEPVLWNLPE